MSNRAISPEALGALTLSEDIQVVGGDTNIHAFRRPDGASVLYVGVATAPGASTFDLNPKWLPADDTFTVNASTNVCTATSHGFVTGDGPYRLSTTDTLPDPLATDTDYWVYAIDDDDFYLCTSLGAAQHKSGGKPGEIDSPKPVDLTDTGTGTHTILAGMDTAVVASGAGNGTFRFVAGSAVGPIFNPVYTFPAPKAVTLQTSATSVVLHVWWA